MGIDSYVGTRQGLIMKPVRYLLACALIWFLSSFGLTAEGFGMEEKSESILAAIGNLIAPFLPARFRNWQASVQPLPA
jgi:ferrous iron transport protein B